MSTRFTAHIYNVSTGTMLSASLAHAPTAQVESDPVGLSKMPESSKHTAYMSQAIVPRRLVSLTYKLPVADACSDASRRPGARHAHVYVTIPRGEWGWRTWRTSHRVLAVPMIARTTTPRYLLNSL